MFCTNISSPFYKKKDFDDIVIASIVENKQTNVRCEIMSILYCLIVSLRSECNIK